MTETFGQRVNERRIGAGLTYQALADLAGITKGYAYEVCRDASVPSVTIAAGFARAFGCTVDDLLPDQHGVERPVSRGIDWRAKYLEIATALGTYQRVCIAVQKGAADGKAYWEASNDLDRLLGEALSWRDHPDLYVRLLKRQEEARASAEPPPASSSGAEDAPGGAG